MKFLVLFLTVTAVATASFVGRKNVDVQEDGTVVIRGDNGKQIVISKQYGPYGKNNIEIEVTGPNSFAKKIQINSDNQVKIEQDEDYTNTWEEDRYKRSSSVASQTDFLDQILKEYQGVVDEKSYQQLLSKVQKAVLKGKVSSDVLNYLQALNEDSKWNTIVSGQTLYGEGKDNLAQNNYGFLNKLGFNTFYGKGFNGIYGQTKYPVFWNKLYSQPKYVQQGIWNQDKFSGEQGIYGQGVTYQMFSNVLINILNKKVLVNIMNQLGVFDQVLYSQVLNENVFYKILMVDGIIDKEALIEYINNPVWKNVLVQQGIFNADVLDQIQYVWYNQGVYDQVLLEQLVNKSVLKYWLINQKVLYNVLDQIIGKNAWGSSVYNNQVLGYDNQNEHIGSQSGLWNSFSGNLYTVNKKNPLWNTIYGQKGLGLNYGTNQGIYNPVQGIHAF